MGTGYIAAKKFPTAFSYPFGLPEKNHLFVSAGVLASVRCKSIKSISIYFQTEFNSNSLKTKTVLSNLASVKTEVG